MVISICGVECNSTWKIHILSDIYQYLLEFGYKKLYIKVIYICVWGF